MATEAARNGCELYQDIFHARPVHPEGRVQSRLTLRIERKTSPEVRGVIYFHLEASIQFEEISSGQAKYIGT